MKGSLPAPPVKNSPPWATLDPQECVNDRERGGNKKCRTFSRSKACVLFVTPNLPTRLWAKFPWNFLCGQRYGYLCGEKFLFQGNFAHRSVGKNGTHNLLWPVFCGQNSGLSLWNGILPTIRVGKNEAITNGQRRTVAYQVYLDECGIQTQDRHDPRSDRKR